MTNQNLSPPDWRGLCEELLDELLARPLIPDSALIDRARALLAQPEPEVREPSDEELLRLAREWDSGYENIEFVEFIPDFARAVLARWGRPAPAPAGEVAKLAADIRHFLSGYRQMRGLDPEHIYSIHFGGAMEAHITVSGLTRIADLLEQRQAVPVPVAVSERLPGPDDCLDEGWAWFFSPRVGWRQAVLPVSAAYTHWLPAHALPLPAAEVE